MYKLFFISVRGNLRSWLPAIGPSRCAPSLRAISVDLDAAADQVISACAGNALKTVNRLIAANDFLGLRAALSKDYSRGQLPQVRELKDALRGRTAVSYFLFFQIGP